MTEYRDRIVDLLWARITLKLQFAYESLLFNIRLAVVVNGGALLGVMALLLHLTNAPNLEYMVPSTAVVFGIGLFCAVFAGNSVRKEAAREIDRDLATILPPRYHSDKLAEIEDQFINMQPTAGNHPAVWWLRFSLFCFTLGLNSEWSLASAIMKGAGRKDESVCPPDIGWKAVLLLAILHRRVRSDEASIAAELGKFDPDAFRSLLTETRFLERHLDNDFRNTLGRIIEERVVRRHLWVALRKFRHQGDYTFLIEMDEGRLRLREKDGPVYTNPRLGPAITFLKDIHLIGDDGLTKRGAEIVSGA